MSFLGPLIGIGSMLMGSKTPKAPDPKQTAREQFRYGIATEMANRMMTSPTVNPFGSYRQHQTGFQKLIGPDGDVMNIPTYETRQTLSPNTQRAFDRTQALQLGALGGLGDFLGYGGGSPSGNVTHASDYMPRRPRMRFPMGTNDHGINYMPGGAMNPFGIEINPPDSGRPMKDVTPRGESESEPDAWHSMSRAERWSGPGPKIALPQITFDGFKPSVSGGFGFHGFGRSMGYDPRRDITWNDGTRTNLNPEGGGIAGFIGSLFGGGDDDDAITWSGSRMKPSGKTVRVTSRSSGSDSDSGSSMPFSTSRPKSRSSSSRGKTYSGRGKTRPTTAKQEARSSKTYSGRSGTSGTSSRKTGDKMPGAWF